MSVDDINPAAYPHGGSEALERLRSDKRAEG